jgi:hypothetical protein
VLLSTNPSQIKGDALRKRNLPILALAGLLFLTACGDTDPTATTTDPGSVTTAAPTTGEDVTDDIATTVAEVQSEVNELATEVQNSAAAAELEESWNALQANVLAAVAAIGDDGTIDGSAIQEELACLGHNSEAKRRLSMIKQRNFVDNLTKISARFGFQAGNLSKRRCRRLIA